MFTLSILKKSGNVFIQCIYFCGPCENKSCVVLLLLIPCLSICYETWNLMVLRELKYPIWTSEVVSSFIYHHMSSCPQSLLHIQHISNFCSNIRMLFHLCQYSSFAVLDHWMTNESLRRILSGILETQPKLTLFTWVRQQTFTTQCPVPPVVHAFHRRLHGFSLVVLSSACLKFPLMFPAWQF